MGERIRPRILLVEPDRKLSASFALTLSQKGWEVDQVGTAAAAVEAIGRARYLAVVAEDQLPDVAGIDVLIAARDRAPDTTRIILSGSTNPGAFNDAINRANVSRFLVKPFKVEELVEAIKVGQERSPANAFSKYTLIRRLAVGGMAEVHLASLAGPSSFRKLVVIKTMLPQFADDAGFREMFVEEGRLVGRFTHPNLGQVFEIGRARDRYFIAMEYIEGHCLSQLVKEHRALPLALVLPIVRDLLSALDYVHGFKGDDGKPLQLVHRDISPSNVMVTLRGCTKLVDFGIAKSEGSVHRTSAGEVRGKLVYMSPEQASGKKIDHRSDLYSVGSLLFELVTGGRAYPAKKMEDLVTQVQQGQHVVSAKTMNGLPPELLSILQRAMAFDPKDRFQSAREFRDALSPLVIELKVLPDAGTIARELEQLLTGVPTPLDLDPIEVPISEVVVAPTRTAPAIRKPPRRRRLARLLLAATPLLLGLAATPLPPVEVEAPTPIVPAPVVERAPAPTPNRAPEPIANVRPAVEPPPRPAPSIARAAVVPRPAASRSNPAPLAVLERVESGRLTIHSHDRIQVLVDGHAIGSTPITVELPIGKHQITVVHSDTGLSQSAESVVEAGIERQITVGLTE